MDKARFGGREEDHGLSALTDARRPTHSMHVVLGRDGRVVLHDPIGWGQVQPASSNVLFCQKENKNQNRIEKM